VSEARLDERIALDGPRDELRELAETFDAMLARLDAAFTAQRSFAALASHELRTPLAIMRTELDVLLAERDPPPARMRETFAVVGEAVDRSERLVDGLLLLAQAERDALQPVDVDLAAIARRELERVRDLDVRGDLQPTHAMGEPVLLEALVGNLVTNAARYNVPGGWVEVRTWNGDGGAHVEVANSGPVIEARDVPRLFEAFHRIDRSRSRSTGGAGLGLAVVRAVAVAHGARLDARAQPEGGLRVRVSFTPSPRPS
jgi:signal transduction histidine kinase